MFFFLLLLLSFSLKLHTDTNTDKQTHTMEAIYVLSVLTLCALDITVPSSIARSCAVCMQSIQLLWLLLLLPLCGLHYSLRLCRLDASTSNALIKLLLLLLAPTLRRLQRRRKHCMNVCVCRPLECVRMNIGPQSTQSGK